MSVTIDVVDTRSVKGGRPPNETVHLIALRQQQLCEIRTILASNTRDQGLLAGISGKIRHLHFRIVYGI